MKYKWRLGVIITIIFIFIVSFKILQPEISHKIESLDLEPGSIRIEEKKVNDSYLLINKSENNTRQKLVDWFISHYTVDWDYPLQVSPWKIASDWISPRQIHPEFPPELGGVLREMSTRKILKADVGQRGTQLKLTLLLEGGQKVVFKPKWYERDYLVTGSPYSGRDRHNAEIAGYHIQRMLGFHRSVIVVGRVIDLKTEILPVASSRLIDTFYQRDGNTCFYGKCLYCKGEETGVCASGSQMEGAVILWLPEHLLTKTWRHPWSRTYRADKRAKWELNDDYCWTVKRVAAFSQGPLLMDFIDASVFDYILSNADRHTYETFKQFNHSMLVMLDAGKSFGNPGMDEKSILAPLYQCCRLREKTWDRLQMLKNGVLSEALMKIMEKEPIAPILTEEHYTAMDRRVMYIIDTIEECIEKFGRDDVLVKDSNS